MHFCFGWDWGFELRASHLQSRCSTAQVTTPAQMLFRLPSNPDSQNTHSWETHLGSCSNCFTGFHEPLTVRGRVGETSRTIRHRVWCERRDLACQVGMKQSRAIDASTETQSVIRTASFTRNGKSQGGSIGRGLDPLCPKNQHLLIV
jgi:hypothetical protein